MTAILVTKNKYHVKLTSDRQVTTDDTLKSPTNFKVRRVQERIYLASSGSTDLIADTYCLLRSFNFEGTKSKLKFRLKRYLRYIASTHTGKMDALLVVRDFVLRIRIADNSVLVSPEKFPCATGSGGDLALAAFLAGADPEKSVDIACTLDPYSGLGVKSTLFNVKKKAK